jgi:ketosteroid isomerase-like protein
MISLSTNPRTISVIAFCSSVISAYVALATAIGPDEQDTAVVSAENVQLATRIMGGLPLLDLGGAFADPERIAEMGATLEPLIAPDLEVVTVGPEYTGEGTVYRGLDGFLEFWQDWLGPWESFGIETEEYLDAGDKVVQLARQVGRTKTGDMPVESSGAAVMTFRDGRLTRIEFHLDRERALRAAGPAE